MTNLVQQYLDWSGKSSVMISVKRFFGLVVTLVGLSFLYAALFG